MNGKIIVLSAWIISVTFPSFSAASDVGTSLPEQILTATDLCAHLSCREVIPEAESFSLRKGEPPYVEAYMSEEGRRKLAGYVFLSSDLVDIAGYSGRPIVALIGMDTKGGIRGVKIVHHTESVLMVGIPEDELTRFVGQYIGIFAGDEVRTGRVQAGQRHVGLDSITGATVSAAAINDIIMRSAYIIAREIGLITEKRLAQRELTTEFATLSWDELVGEGSVQRLRVKRSHVGLKESEQGPPFLDLHFGLLNQPSIGINILGKNQYSSLMRNLNKGDYAIFIIGRGEYSFKGSGFARGGIFERIGGFQNNRAYAFRDVNYYNLTKLSAEGAPDFREGGIFIIPKGDFRPTHPWSLELLVSIRDSGADKKEFYSFSGEYRLPDRYIKDGS